MSADFEVTGTNEAALFSLKVHRGDGMALLAMNWKQGEPPEDFVGFGIEYKEPGGKRWWPLPNRLTFPSPVGRASDPNAKSTLRSPIQKFRWVHFPLHADLPGKFTYRVTPVFMSTTDVISYGDPQKVKIELSRETYPGQLNVAFTRGFVSSQAFVDRYGEDAIGTLLPANADDGLTFVPTHPKANEAYDWMGFEARSVILDLLKEAVADPQARVRVVAYDLNLPEIVDLLKQLGPRLKIIIDDSGSHKPDTSAESLAAGMLAAPEVGAEVCRQHVGNLQHNKTIMVDGPKVQAAVCGSTNLSWRGFFVQSNNAVVVRGEAVAQRFSGAFDDYWDRGTPSGFGGTSSAELQSLGLTGIDAELAFSPHSAANAQLDAVAQDIASATSSVLYSLAFLYETPGVIKDAILKVMNDPGLFVFGISDRKVGGLDVQTPNGNVAPVYPSQLTGRNAPEPFKSEPSGGKGTRMHHKFVVIDFDKPTARVYLGSYNFSTAADTKNGENLLRIRDRRIAVSYAVEALTLFDHWEFRVLQNQAPKKKLELHLPPRNAADKPWWAEDYTDPRKIRDRELFS
jgi:hypothetical protein